MPFECPRTAAGWLIAAAMAGSTAATCLAQSPSNRGLAAQSEAGIWRPTGQLNEARMHHTATLLPNGKVLVVGGRGNYILDTAEVYDAATGTWSAAGRMSLPRYGHTATALADGRVLVVGGDTTNAPPNFGRTGTAEVYDPVAGTFSPTGILSTPRSGHSATLLQDGRVLVAGGFGNVNVAGAELYDPATGTWSGAASLAIARFWHTATRLEDGRVLIARGSNSGDLESTLSSAEAYEPQSGRWSFVGDSGISSVFHTATRLTDGSVLVTGGYGGGVGGGPVVAAARRFDPATQTWLRAPDLSTRRYGHTATLLPGGNVLVSGGVLTNGHYPNLQYTTLASAERFDPANDAWTPVADLGTQRYGHTATLLDNGHVLVAGGGNVRGDTIESAELYVSAVVAPAYRITEIFSDQAGLFQYVLLERAAETPAPLAALTLSMTSRHGVSKQLLLPLSGTPTPGRLCVATQRVSPLSDFGMPEAFLPIDGGTIGLAGIDTWTFGPLPTDGFSSLQRSSSVPARANLRCANHAASVSVPSDLVVEYYNAKLDHYFITASQPDLDALDSGRLPGWQRIGYAFRAFVTRNGSPGAADLQDVCRIYIPPGKGDSHFFSASPAECAASLANHGGVVLESNSAFLARLPDPDTGACPWYYYDEELNVFHWLPQVFRLWNGRVDSNHRYTVDRDVRSAMIARGWVSEGYGPEGVAFCGAP